MPDGLIVAVGPNGEGKTNLLEGIHFLYALGSPRVSANATLVRQGADAAYTRGEFETEHGRVLVEVEIPTQGASRSRSTGRRSGANATSAGRCARCCSARSTCRS